MPSVLISCGEPSGDLYAAALVRELRRLDPSLQLFGFGGERLAQVGCELVGHYRGLTVTGLSEAIRVLPRSFQTYRELVASARTRRPAVFVAVDFPDFNFKLARALRRRGIPVVYYVSPQLWAWRRGRMATMKAIADRVLVIFPFEEEIYRRAGVPVEFIGHPLLDLAVATESRESFLGRLGLDARAPTVGLLPGSRPNELRQILPDLAQAIPRIRERVPNAQFVVARAPNLSADLFAPLRLISGPPEGGHYRGGVETALDEGPVAAIIEGRTDDVLASCDVVVTASGTATVQAAIHGVPMAVVYRLSAATYRIGKPFVHVNTYAMVNLVAGRTIVRELIQDDLSPDSVAAEVVSLLTDSERARQMRADLRAVTAKLGAPGASARAAAAVLRTISQARVGLKA